jgi:probable F420-dependent oxidoreductase
MKFALFGIGSGICADPQVAADTARAAEAARFESVWTGEHVVLPDPQAPPSPAAPDFPMMHPSTVLAYLAGVTSELRLGTGIVLIAQRNPVVLAKEMASLDVLSEGRLILGIGAGYLKAEFDALGVEFETRGARTDEYIDAMRALWGQDSPEFAGRFVGFSGIDARPRPTRPSGPPIVVGGHSEAAFKRAVTRGNGWYGFALDVAGTRQCIEGLQRALDRYERPAELGALEISVTPRLRLDEDVVRQFEHLGVERLISLTPQGSADELLGFIEHTAQTLM